MRKRTTAALAALGLLVAAGGWSAQTVAASAHTPDFTVTCTTAAIDLTNYPAGSTVSGTLDGVDLGTITFGAEGYHGHTALDPAVAHTWNVVVTSGDGDHRFDRTFAGKSDPACIPTPPPTTPPQPAPETHTGEWVDQRGETSCDVDTVATHRTVTTKPFVLVDGSWVVSTDESTWTVTDEDGTRPKTAAELATCAPIPVVGTPTVTITPDSCTPTTKVVRWTIPVGLSIGGVTGTGESIDLESAILDAATGGTEHPRSWVLPVTVLDGYTYTGPTTITLRQEHECATTPPTGEPTTPAPSGGPTTAPTVSPTPTAATPTHAASTPPSAVRAGGPAAPAAVATSGGTDTLAYTGLGQGTILAGGLALGLLVVGGTILLIARTRQRRTENGGGDR